MKTPGNYKEATEELLEIRERLESDLTDLDDLLQDVLRAEFLIKWCREKLGEVEGRVLDILEEGWSEEE